MLQALNQGCASLLVQVADPEKWTKDVLLTAYRESLQRRTRPILFLPYDTSQNFTGWIRFLSNEKFTYLSEVLAVFPNEQDPNILDLVTNKFNTENEWNEIINIEQWQRGKFIKGIIFYF